MRLAVLVRRQFVRKACKLRVEMLLGGGKAWSTILVAMMRIGVLTVKQLSGWVIVS